ncbi:MAG: OFA family MFS transporter [Fusobacteria bacterium]|nr:OFA family MFS transporter [Fusobacteriota bacterium]
MKKYSKILSVPFGIIIFMCLGSVYSWSIFKKPVEEALNLTSTESGLPYVVFLIFYALGMPLSGNFIKKIGPRAITIIGGIFVSLGWFLAGFVNNIVLLVLTYGVMGGIGVGIVYGAPMAVVGEWFPKKRGLAVGLTLGGFGLSPFVTAPLSRRLIETYGVNSTFKIMGIAFFIIIIALSIPLSFPESIKNNNNKYQKGLENAVTLKEVLRNKRFYFLWMTFALGTFTGLMVIGISSPVAEEVIKLSPDYGALAVSIFAIFNGLGRPVFGVLTDKFYSKISGTISYILIIIASIMMLNAKEGMVGLYMISFCIFWFVLGGWLAIAPTAVSNIFGAENYARNYGFLFTAYGVGAIGGGIVSGKIKDIFNSYHYVFIPTLIAGVIGLILIQFVRKKRKIN